MIDLSEKQIELAIYNYVMLTLHPNVVCYKQHNQGTYDKAIGTYRRRHTKLSRKGVPDLVLGFTSRDGRKFVVLLEVKTATGRLSEGQKEFHRDWERAGGLVWTVRSVEDVKSNLEKLLGYSL